jgi:hypothetical protein
MLTMKKNSFALIASSLLGAILCGCTGTKGSPPAAGVVVGSMKGGFPSVTITHKATRDLNHMPEFKTILVRDWRERYDQFAAALVEKARESGLDSASLSEVLKAILAAPESKGKALLPVAAYSTWHRGESVWLIDLRWEGVGTALSDYPMVHVRSYYFTQNGIRQVGFSSCD